MGTVQLAVNSFSSILVSADVVIGHVGDGNFHTLLLIDPSSEKEVTEAQRLAVNMAR